MNIESNVSNYRTGVLPMLILSLLKREDMYGYQIVQTIAEESDGIITPPGRNALSNSVQDGGRGVSVHPSRESWCAAEPGLLPSGTGSGALSGRL